ncbi:MAG: pyridoxamine 5'-phosphate oxidase family protein [Syntrophobacteraceae bacterium]
MKTGSEKTSDILASLLSTQKLAVLSTYSAGQPYSSLVAFAASQDRDCILFATQRDTRKFANILEHPRVAMLVDNRENLESDFDTASAATILGEACELSGREREEPLRLFLQKHPPLEKFATASSCALIQVQVKTFILVENFREITEVHIQ